MDAQAGQDGWSTVGKVVVGLIVANLALGAIGAVGMAIYAAAISRKMEREKELQEEAFRRASEQIEQQAAPF
jgi:hypothetical protein